MVLILLALVYVNIDNITSSHTLGLDYPEFLQPVSADALDARIKVFESKQLGEKDLEMLWKLLWIKKEFYGQNYLTLEQRQKLVENVSAAKVGGLQNTYYILNLLKYKLGVNNAEELKLFSQTGAAMLTSKVCENINALVNEVDFEDSCSVSHFIEAKQFCKLSVSEEDVQAAQKVISLGFGDCVQHCVEHCFSNVPVYVNQCEKAGNENEEYHCLYFSEQLN